MRRTIIGILTVVVLVVLFIVLCTFVRRPYETMLIDRFGKIIVCSDATMQEHPPIMYHWYFKLPTDHVVPVDNRVHLYTSPLLQFNTHGSEPVSVRTFAAWRVKDPVKFYSTISGSDDRANTIIGQKISSLVSATVSSHNLEQLFNTDETKVDMKAMESQIAKESTNGSINPQTGEKMSGVLDQGLEIVQVGFSRMAFPPDNAEAVYGRMAAERNKQAEDYRAQGDAINKTLQEEGDAEAKKILGQAAEESQRTMGEGDKAANGIIAGVQTSPEAREFYQYWKMLDFTPGLFAKNTYYILTTDTPWLAPLFKTPAAHAPAAPAAGAGQPAAGAPADRVPGPPAEH